MRRRYDDDFDDDGADDDDDDERGAPPLKCQLKPDRHTRAHNAASIQHKIRTHLLHVGARKHLIRDVCGLAQ